MILRVPGAPRDLRVQIRKCVILTKQFIVGHVELLSDASYSHRDTGIDEPVHRGILSHSRPLTKPRRKAFSHATFTDDRYTEASRQFPPNETCLDSHPGHHDARDWLSTDRPIPLRSQDSSRPACFHPVTVLMAGLSKVTRLRPVAINVKSMCEMWPTPNYDVWVFSKQPLRCKIKDARSERVGTRKHRSAWTLPDL